MMAYRAIIVKDKYFANYEILRNVFEVQAALSYNPSLQNTYGKMGIHKWIFGA
ncbi:MAG: hypothetical protein ABIO23_04200 [Chitinophagales bacterium]